MYALSDNESFHLCEVTTTRSVGCQCSPRSILVNVDNSELSDSEVDDFAPVPEPIVYGDLIIPVVGELYEAETPGVLQ